MPFVYLCNGCMGRFPPQALRRGRCAECWREYYREENSRRGKTKARGYDQTHKRLSKLAIAQHRYCSDCGATTDLCADHIVPRSQGGANVLSNYRVLCRRCNTARATSKAGKAARLYLETIKEPDGGDPCAALRRVLFDL